MPTADEQVIVDGQRALAVSEVSGDFIYDGGATDIYCIVQKDGKAQRALKVAKVGEGGGGDVPDNVYTQDNLIAGANISITEVAQPLIDENTLNLCHFNDSVADVISGQSDWPSTDLVYLTGKFDKARGFTSTSFKAVAPQINFNQDTTVDFWLAPLTGSGNVADLAYINASSSSTGASFLKFYNPNGSNHKIQIGANFSGTGSNVDIQWTDTSFSWGNFFHVAFEKNVTNGVVYLFVNGKKVYEHAHTSSIGNVTLYGRTNGSSVDGTAFDEFRISNVVRWYTDFTPFSVPYSTTAGATQYQINNTKPDPDLSAYLKNKAANPTYSLMISSNNYVLNANETVIINPSVLGNQNAQRAVVLGASATCNPNCVSVGYNAASTTSGVAIGMRSIANSEYSIAIGTSTSYSSLNGAYVVSSVRGIAIGTEAQVSNAEEAIQLGKGTNETAKTLQVFAFQLLDGTTGLIPAARIGTGYDATKTQVLKNVNGTLTWVDE